MSVTKHQEENVLMSGENTKRKTAQTNLGGTKKYSTSNPVLYFRLV